MKEKTGQIVDDDGITLTPQAITNDGITRPVVTGDLEIVLKCDPAGEPGVATPRNATLIAAGPASAQYVPYRLELSSKCACPGGCSSSDAAAVQAPKSPLAENATMPADGSFIVRLQHRNFTSNQPLLVISGQSSCGM